MTLPLHDGPHRRILIVDDDDFVREVAEMTFTSAGGWDVETAPSGEAGVALATRCRPDVILLDLTMPDMDGLATVAVLRHRFETRAVPIVLLTADAAAARDADDDRLGVAGVVLKPFDPMTLPIKVRQLIGACPAVEQSPEPPGSRATTPGELDAALGELWERYRPVVVGQVADIRSVVHDAQVGSVTTRELEEARLTTHNLVGALGALGLYRACTVARRIDRAVQELDASTAHEIAPDVDGLLTTLQRELVGGTPAS